ncbi:unnamed protein product [Dibothriocephalus latus]|uniref:Uncharacterized protein n=1 Tax=Dibothriocephalus latus TaxID=60516 RepID=A0A3P7LR73_DIBLA|nr:unnamed protein product [Dibothriocephalus latus]
MTPQSDPTAAVQNPIRPKSGVSLPLYTLLETLAIPADQSAPALNPAASLEVPLSEQVPGPALVDLKPPTTFRTNNARQIPQRIQVDPRQKRY